MDNKYKISKNLAKIDLNSESDIVKFDWCKVTHNQTKFWPARKHLHSFYELHLCLSGSCSFEVDGRICTLNHGDYIIFPPYKNHATMKMDENFSKFVLGFEIQDQKLNEEISGNCHCNVEKIANENIYHSINIMLENAESNDFEYYNIMRGQLYYIFITLMRKKLSRKDIITDIKKPPARASEIKKFIQDNISGKMNTSDIAAQFFLSERQANRICIKEYNMSVQELKQDIQLKRIKKFLTNPDMSLKEIASETGFSNEYSVSKFFKKTEGIPPAKYRKEFKNKQ